MILNEEIVEKARRSIGENEQRRHETIRIIRQWIQQQPHLSTVPTDDAFILFFARGCKYRLENVKRKIDTFLSMRTALPEFFSGWDPFKPELQAALNTGTFLPLLEYDQKCRKVIVLRPFAFDPLLLSAVDIEKSNFMISEVMGILDETTFITGIVLIIDLEGFNLNHLIHRPLGIIKKYMRFNQDALPCHPKSVNFIRMPRSFAATYRIISGFATDKIKKRFKVHRVDSSFNSLYKEVPPSILPRDYGGDGPSFSELTGYWKGKVEQHSDFLARMEKSVRADESKRPGKPKTSKELFGIEGSFRKLEID